MFFVLKVIKPTVAPRRAAANRFLHGDTEFLKELEVRSARLVIDPSKSKPKPPKPNEKSELPTLFPSLLHATDFKVQASLLPR